MRVAVLRALPGLGDLLCAVPALRTLARAGAEVTYIGLPQTRALAARFGAYVHAYEEFPGWPGLPEVPLDAARTVAFLARAQREPFDLALQLHGSGVASAGFVQLLGARAAGGYVAPGTPPPGDGWLPWVEEESEVLRPLRLLEHLGFAPAGDALELPLTAAEEAEAAALALPRPYACLHAGSALPDRRWPPERFAAAADALHARGLTPVLTGTPAEREAVHAVLAAMCAPREVLLGRTSLGALAAVLRDARVVVTNDTGVSHVAAAVRAPSVVVHTVTDPLRWAPLDRARHRPLRGDVAVDDVLREADALLDAAR